MNPTFTNPLATRRYWGTPVKVSGTVAAVALAVTAVCFQGCTALSVHKIDNSTQPADQVGSISYILPEKTFLISATYVLNSCRTILLADTKQPSLFLDVDTTLSVVANNEADPDERYFISYADLRSWFKETNVTIESYPNKTLKTVNATLNDQTGPIITAAIGTAIKIGALAAAGASTEEFCDDNTVLTLADVAAKRKLLSTIAKPQGGNTDAQIAEIQKDINKAIGDTLTSKVVLSWSPQLTELKPSITGYDAIVRALAPDQAVRKWLSPKGREWLATHPDEKQTTFIVLEIPSWSHPNVKEPAASVSDGLVLRDPAIGLLRLCKGACPLPQGGMMSVDNVISVTNVVVPQLGRRVVLPLHNRVAENSVLDVSISEDGVITKLGVHSTSTAASSITALGANADAAKSVLDARTKAQNDALTASKNRAKDDNKTLADCLEAQKTIVKDGGSPVGTCE
jgi:hypothetical protein